LYETIRDTKDVIRNNTSALYQDEVDFDDDDDDATVDFDEDDVNSFSNDDTTNDGSWESVDSDV